MRSAVFSESLSPVGVVLLILGTSILGIESVPQHGRGFSQQQQRGGFSHGQEEFISPEHEGVHPQQEDFSPRQQGSLPVDVSTHQTGLTPQLVTPDQGVADPHHTTAVDDSITVTLDRFGYENIGNGKHALVVNQFNTFMGAYHACRSHLRGANLFMVNSAQDSNWLGNRINFEKDRVTGASKFWVGLFSRSQNGPLEWLDGTAYKNYPEVVQVSGHDDNTKQFAWAVPDSFTRLKYEFLTADDEAESYICQYIHP